MFIKVGLTIPDLVLHSDASLIMKMKEVWDEYQNMRTVGEA